MQIDYEVGIALSGTANKRLLLIREATVDSRLDFTIEKRKDLDRYAISVKTKWPAFDSWDEMRDYVRSLVVRHNIELHAEVDYIKLRSTL